MFGLGTSDIEQICRATLTRAWPTPHTDLIHTISEVIKRNNEEIERQLIEKGVINRAEGAQEQNK